MKFMEICEACGKDRKIAYGCHHGRIIFDDSKKIQEDEWERIPFAFTDMTDDSPEMRCPSCNCKHGYLHHWGCNQEICPRCGDTILTCDCPDPRLTVTKFALDGRVKGGYYNYLTIEKKKYEELIRGYKHA